MPVVVYCLKKKYDFLTTTYSAITLKTSKTSSDPSVFTDNVYVVLNNELA